MAIINTQRGFALLIAVIFMSVMLAFALAIGSLVYKQAILASSALESQYAFYAADAALECVLYEDQLPGGSVFSVPTGTDVTFPCGTQSVTVHMQDVGLGPWTKQQFDLGDNHCADISIYKYNTPPPGSTYTTFIFSQGYNVSCSAVQNNSSRYAARGLQAHY